LEEISCYKKPGVFTLYARRPKMNLKGYQSFQVSRFEPNAVVSSFGGILLSTIIVGFALILIAIYASFSLFDKNYLK
jgi:hypothetical protein